MKQYNVVGFDAKMLIFTLEARQLGQEKWPTIRHPRKASRRKGRDLSFRAR